MMNIIHLFRVKSELYYTLIANKLDEAHKVSF